MLLVAFMCHINIAAHETVAIALSGHHRILLCALPRKLIEKQDKERKFDPPFKHHWIPIEARISKHQQTKRSPTKVLVPDTTWILTKYRAVRIRWCTWIRLNVCFWVWLKPSTAVSRLKWSLVEQQTSRLLLKYAQPTQLQYLHLQE